MPRNIPRSPAGVLVLVVVLAAGWFLTRDENDPGSSVPAAGDSVAAKVDRVVDGDTAKVFYEGRSEYVRYIGIDTPESVKNNERPQCFGPEAKNFNEELLGRNSKVKLVFDREQRDHYGRLLAYVYSGSTLLQEELLRRGYATTLEVSPNTSRAGQFARLEDEARREGRGLWSAC